MNRSTVFQSFGTASVIPPDPPSWPSPGVGWAGPGAREALLVRRPFEHATNLQESDHAAQPIHRGGLPPGLRGRCSGVTEAMTLLKDRISEGQSCGNGFSRLSSCVPGLAFAMIASETRDDEFYYAMIFGSQSKPKLLQCTHTSATFIRAVGDGPERASGLESAGPRGLQVQPPFSSISRTAS